MIAVCDAQIIASGPEAITDGSTVSACTRCYDALVNDLIEDESLEDALDRGYVPVILED